MRASRGIRATAWALVAAGVAAPVLRRRLRLSPPVVLGAAFTAPVALSVVVPRGKVREVGVSALNMWAYIAAYEMPHDQPERLARRARVRYPAVADRKLGLGVLPTVRLQRAFSSPGKVNRFERLLVFSHWIWFVTPHGALAYILLRRGDRFPSAAARMYAVFDLGAIFYWAIPTAPPWWAAAQGRLEEGRLEASRFEASRLEESRLEESREVEIRRMMIEYGPVFWGDLWQPLYSFLGGNPLAAMPSLHFATSLMGAHLLSEVGPVSGAVGWGYAGTLGLALVYLGEHYLVDLLAGALLTETVRAMAPRAAPLARRLSAQIDALQGRLAEG